MIAGIITARDGSKGLPGKNLADLGGRPLIEHTFITVQACASVERAFLSTDIPEAIDLARAKYPKVEVPFVRPPGLCTDQAGQVEVVEHLLDHLQSAGNFVPDAIVLFQPTSPFRRVEEVDGAVRQFQDSRCESLLGVSRVLHHPADYIYRPRAGDMSFQWVMRSPEWQRRQDFPEVYFITGALYICSVGYFRKHRRLYDETSALYPMAEPTLIDIDTEFDLRLARGLIHESKQA
jgi:CMP-N-acetylneuraminic acid synthetase